MDLQEQLNLAEAFEKMPKAFPDVYYGKGDYHILVVDDGERQGEGAMLSTYIFGDSPNNAVRLDLYVVSIDEDYPLEELEEFLRDLGGRKVWYHYIPYFDYENYPELEAIDW